MADTVRLIRTNKTATPSLPPPTLRRLVVPLGVDADLVVVIAVLAFVNAHLHVPSASAGCSGPSPEPKRNPVTHPTRLSPCLDTNSGCEHEVVQ